jgi:aryl-alcohol dehydrogenase-like predicted oxidoreductase
MMNRLALGTVQFGLPYGVANKTGQITRLVAKPMFKMASENGIDTLDTAIAYGESETCLGDVGVNEFKVVTKIPLVPNDCIDVGDWVRKQVNESLSRLGVNSVYGLLLHNPSQLLGKNGKVLYQVLHKLKSEGYVQKIGISIYSIAELETLMPHFYFDLVQAPLNIFDRRFSESGWLNRLKDNHVEIHVRSVFLQGLLLMTEANMPEKFSPWSDLLKQWHKWLRHHNVSAIKACLAYPLSFSEIDRIIVGVDSVNQLKEIIAATESSMSCDLPDLYCEDEKLINPSFWEYL